MRHRSTCFPGSAAVGVSLQMLLGIVAIAIAAAAPALGTAIEAAAALSLNKPTTGELIVELNPAYDPDEVVMNLALAGFLTVSRIDAVPDRFNYRMVAVPAADAETMATLRAVEGIRTVRRVYRGAGSAAPIIHTGELIVRFKPGTTFSEVQALAAKYGATISRPIDWLVGGYVLAVPDTATSDAMTVSIAFGSEPRTVYSHPNFFIKEFVGKDLLPIEDPLFAFQWHHRNTGQLDGGVPGADINVLDAWEITMGEGAIAAVIDDCVQPDHEDLIDNYLTGRDYDDDDGDPGPSLPGEGHGTATAGLLLAAANQVGVRGVAPSARLIGVRALGTTVENQAAAFIYCQSNGAMVISNSWGLSYQWAPTIPPLLDTVLADAVKQVATTGRGGRGSLVCFSSGNLGMLLAFNRPTAAQPYVMACGATLRDDTFACYSSYGPEQSVVAPGGGSLFECFDSDITTTDVQDSLIPDTLGPFPFGSKIRGLNPAVKIVIDPEQLAYREFIDPTVDDFPNLAYTHHMNGTSAATPIIAGVAALVYSANSNLSAREVKNLIEHTALKVARPNVTFDSVTGHNERFGHGKVDAYQAVLAASQGRSWPSPVLNVQSVSSQSLVRLTWSNPDWDMDEVADEDVAGVLVVRAPMGQLNWTPVDGVGYDVDQIVAPGVVVVANDLIDSLDQTGLSKGGYEYAIFVRNASNYYSWGRRAGFTSTGAVTVPLASIGTSVTAGSAPLTVHFAGGGIDSSGITSFVWNFGDGGTGSGPALDYTYANPGDYLATLTVTNVLGQRASTAVHISVKPVSNTLPVVTPSATPTTGTAPLVVLFQASATDADGTVVRYDWNFGDGSIASGQVVEHIYLDAGTYGVTVTATDNAGGQASESLLVQVNAPTSTAGEVVTGNNDASALTLPFCGSGSASAALVSMIALFGLTALRRRR